MQLSVALSVELVNVVILNTNHSIMDIIMNFLALVIISEFDDFLVITIEKHLPMLKLIKDGDFDVEENGETVRTVKVSDLLRWEVTTSDSARFNVPGNEFGKTRSQRLKGEPEYIYRDWGSRRLGNKCGRILYRALKAFYAAFWYYFLPFASIFLSYRIPYLKSDNYYEQPQQSFISLIGSYVPSFGASFQELWGK